MRPVFAVVNFHRESIEDPEDFGAVRRMQPGTTYATIAVMADDGTMWCLRAKVDGDESVLMMLDAPEAT